MRIRTDHKQTYSWRKPYITPGKWYDVISQVGSLYKILDDEGVRISTLKEGSAHLDFIGSWEVE